MNIDDIPMVRLTWKDAQEGVGTWQSLEDILTHEPATCQEVGWLIFKDDKKVIVMRSRIVEEGGSISEGSAHIAIPTSWLIKIEELKAFKEIKA